MLSNDKSYPLKYSVDPYAVFFLLQIVLAPLGKLDCNLPLLRDIYKSAIMGWIEWGWSDDLARVV